MSEQMSLFDNLFYLSSERRLHCGCHAGRVRYKRLAAFSADLALYAPRTDVGFSQQIKIASIRLGTFSSPFPRSSVGRRKGFPRPLSQHRIALGGVTSGVHSGLGARIKRFLFYRWYSWLRLER